MEIRIDDRYRVDETLGVGAQAEVLRVFDPLAHTPRALKIAREPGLRKRFRQELLILAAVRHPNIVRAYEYGEHEGRPYFTMERIEGRPLGASAVSPEVMAVLALQILDGLACLHARGWVHRDIKPENILIVGRGSASLVRLIDFGLVAQAGRPSPPAGSLPYVAPEVARGTRADGRADLYSLGVLLYESLTGYEARGLSDIRERYREAPVIDIPGVPHDLSAVVTRLMAPEPEDRYPTAIDAADALASAAGVARGPRRFAMERMVRGGLCHRPAKVRHFLRRAARLRQGRGTLVAVTGPAGIGKSAMIRELGTKLSLSGARVCFGSVTSEQASPIPQLQRIVGGTTGLDNPGGIARELAQGLGERPTVVFLDELHRADAVVFDVLRALERRLASAPVLVIAAHSGDADLGDRLPETARSNLEPFDAAAIQRLARGRLHRLELPHAVAADIAESTDGFPQQVERRLAAMLTDGEILSGPDGFVMGKPSAQSAADVDVRELLSTLDGSLKMALWSAAVVGQRVDSQGVAHVSGLELSTTEAALAELVRLELLSPTRATRRAVYRFAYRELHTAVYRSIPAVQRRTLHDRAAEAVIQGRRQGLRVEERVEHLLKGSDDDAAVRAAVEAGDRAAESFADRRAIEYFARAYARLHGSQDPRSGRIALRLGQLFERTGELERAVLWYRGAMADPDRRVSVAAALGQASIAWVQGDLVAASSAVDSADAQLPSNADDLALRIATMRGRIFVHRGELDRAARTLDDALELARHNGRETQPEAVGLHLELARLARKRGELLEAVRETRRASSLAREHGDGASIVEANMLRAEAFLRVGSLESASKSLFTSLEQVRRRGDRVRETTILRELGHVRFLGGDLDGALERYTEGLSLARAVDARPLESLLLHDVGRIQALQGHFTQALRALSNSVTIAELAGEPRSVVKSLLGLLRTQLELGDLDGAGDSLERIHAESVGLQSAPMEKSVFAADFEWQIRTGGKAPRSIDELPENRSERAEALAAYARGLRGYERFEDVVGELGVLVESGGIEHLRAEWLLLHAELSGSEGDARKAAKLARDRGLSLIRIRALNLQGALRSEGDDRAEAYTRAMELLRSVADDLGPSEQSLLLSGDQALRWRDAFRQERARVLGEDT